MYYYVYQNKEIEFLLTTGTQARGQMIYFITSNSGKLAEARMILGQVEALDIDLPEIQELDSRVIITAKLHEGRKHKPQGLIVEDTSLSLAALNGLPGPLVKWFLNRLGASGLYELARQRGNCFAEAKTVVGYLSNEGKTSFYEGVIVGEIVAPRGEKGFGWDPIFQPSGHTRTFAEMSAEEKNSMSMRARCFQQLRKAILPPVDFT